jgi:hypothetical protein
MRAVHLLALAVPIIAACGGDDDPGSAAGVFPEQGFLGRKLTVEVTGDTTAWDATSQVNFGDGVTVDAITVVSPQALQVDLTIEPDAPGGAHDVTVTDSGDTFTIAGGFTLVSPISINAPAFEQGGIGTITITNLDLLHPFDDSINEETFEFAIVITAVPDSGVSLALVDVTPEAITMSALIDVTATTTGPITITSTTDGVATVTQTEVPVTARAPQVVTAGTPASFTMGANGSLLEITAAQAGLLNLRLTTADTALAGAPGFVVLPASGKWNDFLAIHENFGATTVDAALLNQVVGSGDKFFLIAMESPLDVLQGLGAIGEPGYQATFDATTISLIGVTPVTDGDAATPGGNDTPDTAQALTGTTAQFDGVLTDATDSDCIKIATTAVDQKIHVYTTDENGATDTVVEIFEDDTSIATSHRISSDVDLGEEVVSDPFTIPLTRSICVSASQFVADDFANGAYKAIVVIEN